MDKKKTILIAAASLILTVIVFSFGYFYFFVAEVEEKKEVKEPIIEETEIQEIFNLSDVVYSIDVENNSLMVKPLNQEEMVKVILSKTAELIKLEFPFDPEDFPKEATFTPKQTEIEIADFKQGDEVFIKTKESIVGRSELDKVDFIHILP